ncbi:MAG: DUF3298 domain-containing protein [Lachnotalea sp.]
MKKTVLVALGIAMCVCLVGCQSKETSESAQVNEEQNTQVDTDTQEDENAEAQENTETQLDTTQQDANEGISEEVEDSNPDVSITFEDKSQEKKDVNNTLLLTVTGNSPTVTIAGNVVASDKINAYYINAQKQEEDLIQEYIKDAQDNIAMPDTDLQYWNGYGLGNEYTKRAVTDSIISIVQDGYEDMGGAHPNAYRNAQNFDIQTGELLTLKDILTNVDQGTTLINDYLLKLMKESEQSSGLFDNYEDSIGDVLTDTSWYLSDEGLVVICSEGIVSPHAVGIQEFVIPYKDCTFLVDKYQKN